MKLYIFLIISNCFFVFQALGQQQQTSYKFYSFTTNKNKIIELTKTTDSVIISFLYTNAIIKSRFSIVSEEARGKFSVLYLQRKTEPRISTLPGKMPYQNEFASFVYYTSKNSESLSVLAERNSYKSLSDVMDANKNTGYKGKYFTTWYSKENLDKLQQFKDFRLATKNEAEEVTTRWLQYLQSNLLLIRNTNDNITDPGKDNLTKALIDYRFNPRIGMADFSRVVECYHITLPTFVFDALEKPNLEDTEAVKHIGENRIVSGIINEYKTIRHSKRILLFCGVSYPKQYFTVIVENRFSKDDNKTQLKGRSIGVKGKIIKFKGMPAIKVPDWKAVWGTLKVD